MSARIQSIAAGASNDPAVSQSGELIDSEGVLAIELCKPVMFADRIR